MKKRILVPERHAKGGTITIYPTGHTHKIEDGEFSCDECGEFISLDQDHLSVGYRVDHGEFMTTQAGLVSSPEDEDEDEEEDEDAKA